MLFDEDKDIVNRVHNNNTQYLKMNLSVSGVACEGVVQHNDTYMIRKISSR